MKNLLVPILALGLTTFAQGAVLSGTSSARDITASASVSGSLLGVALATVNVAAGPINEASGTAPAPYNSDPALGVAAAASSGIVLPTTLSLDVTALDLTAISNVDGGTGPRSANATGMLTTASAALNLDLGGAIGNLNLIQIIAGNGTTTFTSNSQVVSDGTNLSPSANTNLLSSGTGVSVFVLGSNVTLSGLAAGVTTIVNVNISSGSVLGGNLVNVTGTVAVTPDLFTVTGLSLTSASASATALRVLADLNVSASGGLTNLIVRDEVFINQTTANLTAVPEPNAAALAVVSGLLLIRTRRRVNCSSADSAVAVGC